MSQVAHPTTAQSNQVPPTLRKFAADHCHAVAKIKRFNPENETHGRGWVLKARKVDTTRIPVGYRGGIASATVDGYMRIQIREE